MKGTLYGVSVGPGDPGLVTLRAVEVLRGAGEDAWIMGEVVAGEGGVVLC